MNNMLKRALKPLYRKVYPPMLATLAFRRCADLARMLGILPRPEPRAKGTQERFLIVSLTPHLGDTVMMMPMIESLRKAHPQARIECAVEAAAAPLLRMMPIVDRVYALKLGRTPPTTPWLAIKRTLNVTRRYWEEMRQSAPTICIMPRWGDDVYRSSVLAYLTGASRRIGFASSDCSAGASAATYRDKLLTELVRGASGMHEPAKFCLLLEESGLIPRSDLARTSSDPVSSLMQIAIATDWAALAKRIGINTALSFAVIAPGASIPRRVWPIEFWAEIVDYLYAKGMQVVLLTGAQDAEIANQLHALTGDRTTVVAGKTSLAESVTLISNAKLFLGNDSGPGHLAGALGIPSVIMFIAASGADPNGPSAPERIHPIGPYVEFCRPPQCLPPCDLWCDALEAHCIKTISPNQVIEAAKRVEALKVEAESVATSR